MKLALVPRRRICLALALVFILSSMPFDVEARQRFSTIQGNVHEEAEIAPYAGGRKAGPIHDWELLCKIEGDPELQAKALKEAKEGNLDNVFVLACMYFHGKGVEKNQAAAFELFKYAANKGHSNSQNNLGFMFEEGLGTKKDLKQAMAWYQKAADYKNGAGTCNLANMIEHGRGVPANPEQAYTLYQKAAELGNKIAGQNVFAYDFEKERLAKIKGATPSKPGTKTAALPKTGFTYNPASATPPVVADAKGASSPAGTSIKEEKAASATSGLQAGTPTLTAILNRLSKGTSLEQLAKQPEATQPETKQTEAKAEAKQPDATVAAEPKKEEPKAEAKKQPKAEPKKEAPVVAAKPETKRAEVPKQESKAEDKKPLINEKAPVAAAPKPSGSDELLAKTIDRLPKPKAADKPAQKAAEKAVEKPAQTAEKPIEKPAAKTAEKLSEKPAVAAAPVATSDEETKEAAKSEETKTAKSALDTPITYGSAPKVEAKPEPSVETAADKPTETKPVETKKAESKPVVAEAKPKEKKAETKATETKSSQSTAAAVAAKPTTQTPKPTAPAKVDANPASAVIKAASSPTPTDKNGVNRPIRDKWAMVVGITDFDDPDIPDLQFSAKDATDFYNYLVKEANFQPDHVRLILNEQATQRRVLSELGSKFLARVVKPDDLVVLFFSTHGSPSQLDPRGKNYLVACDSDSDDLFATGIEMQKLLDSIQGRVLTDRVLLVMDACHSGFAAPDSGSKGIARLGNFKADELAQGSGQVVICSSMPEERAWESTRYSNGVFTHRLLQGLRASGSSTTLIEAFRKTQTEVGIEVREDRPGAKQTPVLKGKWNGNDLILASVPYAPQAVPLSVSKNLSTDSRVDLLAAAPAQGVRNVSEGKKDADGPTKPSNESAPRSGDIYLDAQFFSVKGDPRSVAKEYQDAIRANGSDPELHFLRAKALIQLEDWHNAMACLNEAIQLSPNRANYYLGRAYVYFRQGKTVLADQDLAQAKFQDKSLGDKVRFHK